ncbi:MAG: glycosyltransferase family 2 protein [Candidatus Thermoplasmatota archaeon]|nr:glycosyltransferase family 2 protein [Candidatus Thermoplasmatota archaeon]
MNFHLFLIFAFDFSVILISLVFIGLTYLALVRSKSEDYEPFDLLSVLVIVPCRGLDYSLEANLRSIANQDYPNYKVVAVVDGEDDPAIDIIKKIGINWMLTQNVCISCSGKVRALSTAIESETSYDIYVIADSDIYVERNWLLELVSPFKSPDCGISTTFPYFRPIGGFWSKMKMVWGFVGQGMMESKLTRFGWGGSLAFRPSLLSGENFDFFKGYISDDIALTKLCQKEGKTIAYVKKAMPVVNSPDDFNTFMEWANRQTALTVYSTKKYLYYGILFYGSSIFLFSASLILCFSVTPLFLAYLLPSIINSSRAVKRSGRLPVTTFILNLIVPFLYFYNLVKASRMREISWRGRKYPLKN